MDVNKLLSPWMIKISGLEWKQYRFSITGNWVGIIGVGKNWINKNIYWGRYRNRYSREFSLMSDAIHYVDRSLLDDGYVFLTQDQWDNYRLLM